LSCPDKPNKKLVSPGWEVGHSTCAPTQGAPELFTLLEAKVGEQLAEFENLKGNEINASNEAIMKAKQTPMSI
jgi:hypothetical protein